MRTIYTNYARILTVLMLAVTSALLAGLAGCGASGPPSTTADSNSTAAASITLTAIPVSVKSDGTTSATITATVLNSSNTVLSGQTVNFATSTGQLIGASGVTDTNGALAATFSAGPSGINRIATITATSGTASSQIPVQILGSTVTANPASASVLDNGSNTAKVTFTALNASSTAVPNTPITITKTGVGNITFTPASGTTDINGQFLVTVTGVAGGDGTATLTAAALGATATADIEVTALTTSFSVTGLNLSGTTQTSAATNAFSSTSMATTDTLTVTVSAPTPATRVYFTSTMGVWNGLTNAQIVPVAGGVASATLSTALAGLSTVQVFDPDHPTATDSIAVAMTAVTPYSVTLQATPSVVPKGSSGTATLIATVKDTLGQPVGGVPVAFSIVNPTGGGESVSPVVAYTATTPTANLGLGQASATFTAGSVSSIQSGVNIRGHVLGTGVVTNTPPSGTDATIVIGGTPSSVAFGQATELGENSNATQYILAMSVMVSDSNGNPAPAGTVVNLSLWPIAWSTGTGCTVDPDGYVWNGLDTTPRGYIDGDGGTFYNEDINENLMLDTVLGAVEDGTRNYYADARNAGAGTTDTYITPANSVAGSIPATVTTGANGIATFDLYYPKTSAIWVVNRIRGRTVVQGSDAVGETQFRLGALDGDLKPCRIPDSPFRF